MAYKPFKMKGSPMQRNFNIGKTESPDAETPLNINLGTALSGIGAKVASNVAGAGGWGTVAAKALSAGMGTLKGGYDAYNPPGEDIMGALNSLPQFKDMTTDQILASILEKTKIDETEDDE